MPNAWDIGSAKILAQLGFKAIATTSSGSPAAVGRLDGELGRAAAGLGASDAISSTPGAGAFMIGI
jgi:2-methylisocitrate lyase-like PEP mutase family enzyme